MNRIRGKRMIGGFLCSLFILSSLSGCGTKGKSPSSDSGGTETNATSEVSESDILTESIELNPSGDYIYDPEEVMYLSGVKSSAYTKGVEYALRDMDGDSVSELFISVNGTVGAYAYDSASNQAKRTNTYDDQIESLKADETLIWVDGGSQWVDGTIYGAANQTKDPGVKTDFYTSSNYDWLTSENIHSQGDSLAKIDQGSHVEERIKELFTDREKYQGEDIQRVRDYYDIATNWDKREEEGIEPVKKYLTAIDSISSLSDMTDYLSNPEKDPFCLFLKFYTTLDVKDTSKWIVTIQGDDFSILSRIFNNEDTTSIKEGRMEYDITARYVLEKAGYGAQDIDRIMKEFYEIEDELLKKDWPSEGEDETDELLSQMPIDTLASRCENFPLDKLFAAYNITEGNANVEYPDYLRTLDSLYVEDNLSKLKSYCLAHTAYEASSYLSLDVKNSFYNHSVTDATAVDAETEDGMSGYTREDLENFYQDDFMTSRGIVGVAAENAYMTYFVDDDVRSDITELSAEIKNAFRDMLENEEWMSDDGKMAAIEKLDNMEFTILKPDTLIDSSFLSVNPESSFLDAYAGLVVNTRKHKGELVGKERVKGEWRYDLDSQLSTTVDNCFYYGAYNQFFIMDGFLTDDVYRLDMTKEEKLGALGEVIAHELTHGFDPNGIQYDKNGNMVVTEDNPYGWMPEADYNAFKERADKLANYFSKFVPYPYNKCDGSLYWGEAAADIAGMSIGLKIAEGEKDFDYDLYFRNHSKLWAKQSTLIVEQGDIFNEHPLDYLRINAVCQQFDEFNETYGVKEGDLMYLAPEDRVKIW